MESSYQEQIDRIVRRVGRLRAGLDTVSGQMGEMLQVELIEFFHSAFEALKPPMTSHPSQLSRCVPDGVSIITDAPGILVEVVEAFRSLAVDN